MAKLLHGKRTFKSLKVSYQEPVMPVTSLHPVPHAKLGGNGFLDMDRQFLPYIHLIAKKHLSLSSSSDQLFLLENCFRLMPKHPAKANLALPGMWVCIESVTNCQIYTYQASTSLSHYLANLHFQSIFWKHFSLFSIFILNRKVPSKISLKQYCHQPSRRIRFNVFAKSWLKHV